VQKECSQLSLIRIQLSLLPSAETGATELQERSFQVLKWEKVECTLEVQLTRDAGHRIHELDYRHYFWDSA